MLTVTPYWRQDAKTRPHRFNFFSRGELYMNVIVTLYVALLFVALAPGVLLTLPKGGKKLVVAAVHGLVFAIVYQFTIKMVLQYSMSVDGFGPGGPGPGACSAGMTPDGRGGCVLATTQLTSTTMPPSAPAAPWWGWAPPPPPAPPRFVPPPPPANRPWWMLF